MRQWIWNCRTSRFCQKNIGQGFSLCNPFTFAAKTNLRSIFRQFRNNSPVADFHSCVKTRIRTHWFWDIEICIAPIRNKFSDVVADRTAFFAYCAGKNTFRRLCCFADAGVVLAVCSEAICILVFCATLGDCRCGNCFRNECSNPLFPAERTCHKTDCSFHIPFDFHRRRCGDYGNGCGQRAAEALCKFCRFFRTVDTISMVLFIGGGAVVSRNYSDRPPAAFSISRLKKKNHNL